MQSGDTVVLRLPSAPPAQYLRWMSYWRRIERRMAANPFLEALASAASAPFLHDEVARFISGDLLPQIERQARKARRARQPSVAPSVEGDRELLRRSVDYVIRRARWLQRPETSALTRLPPLEEEVANLRARVLAVAQLQLGLVSEPPPDESPPG